MAVTGGRVPKVFDGFACPAAWSFAAILCLLTSSAASAQNLTGEIDGTVHDSSGGAIPNAMVTLRNTDQNAVARTVKSDQQGHFTVPLLAIGHYSLTVGSAGFETSTVSDIDVHVNQPVSIPVVLAPGAVSQTVNVSASSLGVQLDSAAAGTLINNTQMTQLSLSSRNFEQLLYIQPGISGPIPGPKDRGSITAAGSLNTATFSVNGQPTNANGYFVDGQDFVIHAGNQPSIFPGIDFIQEMNLERSNYGAQYGGEGSAFTTLETKSGTTAFHGGAYEFFRSQILNANGYFNNLAGIARPGIRYNDYGYDIGGPVWIPGVSKRDTAKTFFYFGQEFLRQESQSNETLTNIPTAAQRQGLFDSPVCVAYNAAGKCTKSATSIGAINPTAQAYLTDIINKTPLPNSPNDPQGLISTQRGFSNETQTFIRIDHQFNDKLSVFFRYLDDPFHLVVPYGIRENTGVPGVGTSTATAGATAYLGHVTYTVSPTTVLEGGYSYLPTWLTAEPIGLLSPLNSPNIRPTLPYTSTLARVPDLHINGSSYAAIAPYNQRAPIQQVFLNATHTAGRHILNFGFSLDFNQSGNNYGQTNAGSYTFSAGAIPAGSKATQFDQSFANFLLGQVSTFQQTSIDAASQIVQNYYEGYIQDDFHVTSRLTINGGLRYSYFHQPTNNPLSGYQLLPVVNFDPALYSATSAPRIGSNGLICTASPCAGGGTPNLNYNTLNGIIIGGKTSPYGNQVTYQPQLTFAPRIGFSYDVLGNGHTALRGGYGVYYMPPPSAAYQTMVTLNPPNVTNTSISNTSFGNPGNGVPALSASPLVLQASQPNTQTPYMQAWDVDLQQQIGASAVLDIGYFGNRGVHVGATEDINQPTPGLYAANGIVPGNQITTGNSVLLNQIRRYGGYGPIDSFNQIFSSNYNGLQVSVRKRFSHGSFIAANYTYSKSLSNGDTSPQDIYDLQANYGPTANDRTHVFTAYFVYPLPVFRSQKGLIGHVLGGWETTGIISYGSGFFLTPHTINADPAGLGILAAGSSASGGTPDYVSNANAGAPHTLQQWFSTNAFTQVPAGQYRIGNSGIGVIRGPGYENWDISLFKNLRLERAVNFQLRGESFNTFNHTNFAGVGTTLSQTNYGQITSTGPARVLQLAGKITF